MRKQHRAAIEAVARHFAATWNAGESRAGAYLTIAGKRIDVGIASVAPIGGAGDGKSPRLRFDRVALGFVARLHAALGDIVPDGQAVILTVTAPIRSDSKTAAALEQKIRGILVDQRTEIRQTIYGNRIRVRLVKAASRKAPKLSGFVHNPETNPGCLLDIAQSLLACVGPGAEKRTPFAGERWLILVGNTAPSLIDTWRRAYSVLSIPTEYRKVLIVSAEGQVESLSD